MIDTLSDVDIDSRFEGLISGGFLVDPESEQDSEYDQDIPCEVVLPYSRDMCGKVASWLTHTKCPACSATGVEPMCDYDFKRHNSGTLLICNQCLIAGRPESEMILISATRRNVRP